jgi:sulfoxide reductase heme-binding subunit YedZ
VKYSAWLKPLAFAVCLLPLARLGWLGFNDGLGANPIEFITRSLGTWSLGFLLITLAVSPVRRLTGLGWPIRLRRMFGLYAFFYATLHFLSYIWLDQFFDWAAIAKDIAKRPFITVGVANYLLLIPLALTSTDRMVRRLGRRWQQLHRLVYVIAAGGVVHYYMLVKQDVTQPVIYGAVFGALLGYRVWIWWRAAMARAALCKGARALDAFRRG